MAMDDDAVSVAWSSASETERLMFTVLSNVDRVDLAALPRLATAAAEDDRPAARVEELPRIVEEEPAAPPPAAEAPPPPLAYEAPPPPLAYEAPPPPLAYEAPPPAPPADEAPAPPAIEHTHAPPAVEHPHAPPAEHHHAPPAEHHHPPPPPPPSYDASPPPAPERLAGGGDAVEAVALPPREEVAAPRMDPEEEELEKRSVLLDLQRFEQQGVRLTRAWTMADRLEDMTLELRRIVLAMDERSNVNMMRDGLKMLVTGVEMVSNRFRILDLEGWSSDVCQDLHRFDSNLGRIYRKYWRRSTSNSPEGEIAFALLGSLGMHHMKRTMTKQMLSGGGGGGFRGGGGGGAFARRRPASPDTSDDEQPPPRRA